MSSQAWSDYRIENSHYSVYVSDDLQRTGQLTHREFLIATAIAYWREEVKNKPNRPGCDRGIFTNSDP